MTDLRFAPVDPVEAVQPKPTKREFVLPSTKGKASKAGDLGNRSQELRDSPNAERLALRKFTWEQ